MRGLARLFSATLFACGVAFCIWQLLVHPQTPLAREWNPTKRLYIEDPVTWLTGLKLDMAADNEALCTAVLGEGGARFVRQPDLEHSPQCFIRDRVALSAVGRAQLATVETTCAVALRAAMWEQHGLQPAARRHLAAEITQINHFSSYSCRPIRGSTSRMSLHATAEALDVSGVVLSDGRQLSLLQSWTQEREFWTAVRDSACTWFETVLGPDFNRLHADHFHLQSRGWGTCS